MLVESQFSLMLYFRNNLGKLFSGLSEEQLLKTPDNISNNIVWNVGHILFYEGVFLYGQCGQDLPTPEPYKGLYKGGSSPAEWSETPDVAEVIDRYSKQGAQSLEDFKAGKFADYKEMKINDQVTLKTLEEGMSFHLFHEGVHLGRIMTLAKLV